MADFKLSMIIEVVKSIGKAKCIVCNKIIANNKLQVRITDSNNFTKSVHLQCILALTDRKHLK